jgi:preprotein translocase subunit YajC
MNESAPSPILQFLPLVFLFIIFYFLLIRPQQKRQKEHADLLAKLEKNDEVITAGGVHATVISVGDKTVIIRIAENVKVEVEKSSITAVTKKRE